MAFTEGIGCSWTPLKAVRAETWQSSTFLAFGVIPELQKLTALKPQQKVPPRWPGGPVAESQGSSLQMPIPI